MQCKDRVALVTGAAGSGMGRSAAITLAREGARVAVNYRHSQSQALQVVDEIRSRGGIAMPVQADVTSAEDCGRMVRQVQSELGALDVCIIGPGGGWHPQPPHELPCDDALSDASAELGPVYNLLPLVLPGMYERKWGRVIGLSMLEPFQSPAYSYNVGKAARTQALLLAKDHAWRHGVTINVISPGPVEGIDDLKEAIEQSRHADAWSSRSNVSPQDIAEGIAFLCSESGRFVTGCQLTYMWR